MIKIERPGEVPQILKTAGLEATRRLEELYAQDPRYRTGELVFVFRSEIYAHADVKAALLTAQHGKCCFCESQVGADGDVEHYRPKGGVSNGAGAQMQRPGYFWLAYEWSNLLLCCGPCNQRFKRNLFPLLDPNTRCRDRNSRLDAEEPLFINPAEQDPEQYISFRREIPYAVDGNRVGKETIDALRLDRPALNERRRDALERAKLLFQWLLVRANSDLPEVVALAEETREHLARSVSDAGEFSGMLRCAQKNHFYSN
jgi:uncharacterized protein (TIGR02646 family)